MRVVKPFRRNHYEAQRGMRGSPHVGEDPRDQTLSQRGSPRRQRKLGKKDPEQCVSTQASQNIVKVELVHHGPSFVWCLGAGLSRRVRWLTRGSNRELLPEPPQQLWCLRGSDAKLQSNYSETLLTLAVFLSDGDLLVPGSNRTSRHKVVTGDHLAHERTQLTRHCDAN